MAVAGPPARPERTRVIPEPTTMRCPRPQRDLIEAFLEHLDWSAMSRRTHWPPTGPICSIWRPFSPARTAPWNRSITPRFADSSPSSTRSGTRAPRSRAGSARSIPSIAGRPTQVASSTIPRSLLGRPKVANRLPTVLRVGEAAALMDAPAPADADEPVAVAVRLRDEAILELLYGSGLRVSEVTTLHDRGSRSRGRSRACDRQGVQRASRAPVRGRGPRASHVAGGGSARSWRPGRPRRSS